MFAVYPVRDQTGSYLRSRYPTATPVMIRLGNHAVRDGAIGLEHASDESGAQLSTRCSASGHSACSIYRVTANFELTLLYAEARATVRSKFEITRILDFGDLACRWRDLMRLLGTALGVSVLSLSMTQLVDAAAAATPERMMQECRVRAGEVLRTRLPNIETKYEGQRTDGTHAVNGTARSNGRTETFQCSFNRSGRRIINFVVNQPSGGSSAQPGRPPREPETRTERVKFLSGATGTTLNGSLGSGDSVRYVLGARNEQFLTVILEPGNAQTNFNIFTPKNSTLYESAKAGNTYKGQLYLDGDHVIEVFNRGQGRSNYKVFVTLKNHQSGASSGHSDPFARAKADCASAVAKQVGGGKSPSVIDVKRGENFLTVRVRVPGAQAPWICEHSSREVMRVYYGAEG